MGDDFGLDKAARNQAKHEAKDEAEKPQPPDPPFPFKAEPFDPEFFRLTADAQPLGDV